MHYSIYCTTHANKVHHQNYSIMCYVIVDNEYDIAIYTDRCTFIDYSLSILYPYQQRILQYLSISPI